LSFVYKMSKHRLTDESSGEGKAKRKKTVTEMLRGWSFENAPTDKEIARDESLHVMAQLAAHSVEGILTRMGCSVEDKLHLLRRLSEQQPLWILQNYGGCLCLSWVHKKRGAGQLLRLLCELVGESLEKRFLGRTPLQQACSAACTESIQVLCDLGADRSAVVHSSSSNDSLTYPVGPLALFVKACHSQQERSSLSYLKVVLNGPLGETINDYRGAALNSVRRESLFIELLKNGAKLCFMMNEHATLKSIVAHVQQVRSDPEEDSDFPRESRPDTITVNAYFLRVLVLSGASLPFCDELSDGDIEFEDAPQSREHCLERISQVIQSATEERVQAIKCQEQEMEQIRSALPSSFCGDLLPIVFGYAIPLLQVRLLRDLPVLLDREVGAPMPQGCNADDFQQWKIVD
jgi:hypothetical protein